MGMGLLWLNGWDIYSLNGWGSHGKLLFCFEICSKNAGLQGSTLTNHCMTTGFGPLSVLPATIYFITQFCVASIREWLLIERGIY